MTSMSFAAQPELRETSVHGLTFERKVSVHVVDVGPAQTDSSEVCLGKPVRVQLATNRAVEIFDRAAASLFSGSEPSSNSGSKPERESFNFLHELSVAGILDRLVMSYVYTGGGRQLFLGHKSAEYPGWTSASLREHVQRQGCQRSRHAFNDREGWDLPKSQNDFRGCNSDCRSDKHAAPAAIVDSDSDDDNLFVAALVDRKFVYSVSDKRAFGRLARAVGIEGAGFDDDMATNRTLQVVPRTFESLAEVREEVDYGRMPDSQLLFVKGRHGCLGEEVTCTTARKLLENERAVEAARTKSAAGAEVQVCIEAVTEEVQGLPDEPIVGILEKVEPLFEPERDIVQCGVQRLWLYEGRFKITMRAYLIAWDGHLLLSRDAYGIIHIARDYNEGCDDYDLQVANRSADAGKVLKIPFHQMEAGTGNALFSALERAVRAAAPMFASIVDATRQDAIAPTLGLDVLPRNDGSVCFRRYAMMGIDALPQARAATIADPKDLSNDHFNELVGCQLIECNFFPNVDQGDLINAEVTVPMVRSLMRLTVRDMGLKAFGVAAGAQAGWEPGQDFVSLD